MPRHGGTDHQGVPAWDFSTNSNACGPCPQALEALQKAAASHYPDPQYIDLRQRLAALHNVAPGRILLATSGSEFIYRMTATTAHAGGHTVCLPLHSYSDYAMAAQAWGLETVHAPAPAQLLWGCEPSSPLGQVQPGLVAWVDGLMPGQQLVLDCAYSPLRLEGQPSLDTARLDKVWQLWTPNKALGLTGIRAAYVIAPASGANGLAVALDRMCASWPVGAHGVAMLQAWCSRPCQDWLAASLLVLREWKQHQQALCTSLGWACLPSDANFFCARVLVDDMPRALAQLRAQGVKLRHCAAFRLPDHVVRMRVMPPAGQDALLQAWAQVG